MTYKEMLEDLLKLYKAYDNKWTELTDNGKNEQVYIAKFWKQGEKFANFMFDVNRKPAVDEQSVVVQVINPGSWEDIREFSGSIKKQLNMLFDGGIDYDPEFVFEGTVKQYNEWEIE